MKRERGASSGVFVGVVRRVKWWLEGDVGSGWGVRGRWIAGLAWGAWLLFLSFHRTGDGRSFFGFFSLYSKELGKFQPSPSIPDLGDSPAFS